MLVICLSGSKPVRRWNSAIVCLSACDSAASAWTLAAAGLARSCTASTPATMRAEAGNSAMRPCTVSVPLGDAVAAASAATRGERGEGDDDYSAADDLGSHEVQRRACLDSRRRVGKAGIGFSRARGDEVSRIRREELSAIGGKLGTGWGRGRDEDVRVVEHGSSGERGSKAAEPAVKRDGKALELWTDGACSGNPGPMGIGIVAVDGGKRREHGEYLGVGTNNIAELTAIERALELAGDAAETRHVRVYTDSALFHRRAVEGLEGEGEPGADCAHAPGSQSCPTWSSSRCRATPASPRTSAATSWRAARSRGGRRRSGDNEHGEPGVPAVA